MELLGTVQIGVIVLDANHTLPEGTRVRVTAVAQCEPLGKFLMEFAGTIDGLPSDMAAQHDHYIHGRPKK
jgi:hypothetical protein